MFGVFIVTKNEGRFDRDCTSTTRPSTAHQKVAVECRTTGLCGTGSTCVKRNSEFAHDY